MHSNHGAGQTWSHRTALGARVQETDKQGSHHTHESSRGGLGAFQIVRLCQGDQRVRFPAGLVMEAQHHSPR